MHFANLQLFAWSVYIFVAQQIGLKVVDDVPSEEESLVLLHVIFRHGNRTVNGPDELYPKDPYVNETYFPYGLGQLTNAGKVREYSVGKALRKKYNNFLGSYYYPDYVEGWSTDYNRTKASLELVFAGLFPPYKEEVWDTNFIWQPIPYNYLPAAQDKVLLGVTCPYYLKLYDEHIQSEHLQTELDRYRQIFKYIANNTGLNITKYLDVYNLYFGLTTEEEWGFHLPEWTKSVWPNTIIDLSIKEYFVSTATTEMNRMASGYFLQKVVSDSFSKINNTSKKKIHLYSAHENNIAELLILLGIFEPLHIPDYGSYVVFEVHKIEETYGIKIYYENYVASGPQLLKLPACDSFCEINQFVSLIEEYFPDEDLCYKGQNKCK